MSNRYYAIENIDGELVKDGVVNVLYISESWESACALARKGESVVAVDIQIARDARFTQAHAQEMYDFLFSLKGSIHVDSRGAEHIEQLLKQLDV